MAMYIYEVLEPDKILRKHDKETMFLNRIQVESQLTSKAQIKFLFETGLVKVRRINSKEVEAKVAEKVKIKKEKQVNKEYKEYKKEQKVKELKEEADKKKKDYKVDYDSRKNRYELYRKNPKGYYNFVQYLESESDKDEAIEKDIKDILKQKQDKKNKKAEIVVDDDI